MRSTVIAAAARMQRGQLGHGDLIQRNVPSVVEALAGKEVIAGAAPISFHTSLLMQSHTYHLVTGLSCVSLLILQLRLCNLHTFQPL